MASTPWAHTHWHFWKTLDWRVKRGGILSVPPQNSCSMIKNILFSCMIANTEKLHLIFEKSVLSESTFDKQAQQTVRLLSIANRLLSTANRLFSTANRLLLLSIANTNTLFVGDSTFQSPVQSHKHLSQDCYLLPTTQNKANHPRSITWADRVRIPLATQ